MSIAFESEQTQLQKLRERLRQMSDEELIKFGKTVRGLSEPRVSVTSDPWKAQLAEARAEWRRRHPKCFWNDRRNSQFLGRRVTDGLESSGQSCPQTEQAFTPLMLVKMLPEKT